MFARRGRAARNRSSMVWNSTWLQPCVACGTQTSFPSSSVFAFACEEVGLSQPGLACSHDRASLLTTQQDTHARLVSLTFRGGLAQACERQRFAAAYQKVQGQVRCSTRLLPGSSRCYHYTRISHHQKSPVLANQGHKGIR